MNHTKCSLWTFLASLFLIFSITGCKQATKSPDEDGPPREEKPVDPPRQIVSLQQAKKTYDTYTERRVGLIERSEAPNPDGSNFMAARYVYYDYKTVKQYMAYIEQEAREAHVEISSLRFYFSNYPDSTSFESGRKIMHPRQNSIFLIPATRKGELEYPFYLAENQDGNYEAALLTGQLDPYGDQGMGQVSEEANQAYAGFVPAAAPVNRPGGTKSLIMNEGSSAPPPSN